MANYVQMCDILNTTVNIPNNQHLAWLILSLWILFLYVFLNKDVYGGSSLKKVILRMEIRH